MISHMVQSWWPRGRSLVKVQVVLSSFVIQPRMLNGRQSVMLSDGWAVQVLREAFSTQRRGHVANARLPQPKRKLAA